MKKFLLGGVCTTLVLYSVGSTLAIHKLVDYAMFLERRGKNV